MGTWPSSWFGKSIENRLLWVVIFFVVSVLVMAIGASMPVDPIEAKEVYNEIESTLPYIGNVQFIFGNNFIHTLIMFTPFLGPIYGTFIFFNTGVVLAMFAVASNVNAGLLLVLLFLTPVAWLEFLAYSLALAQSVLLTIAIFKGRFKQELPSTCIIITICALILFLAAIIEVSLMSLG